MTKSRELDERQRQDADVKFYQKIKKKGYLRPVFSLRSLQIDDLAGSRVESPGLLEDWWQGYPVWQGQREAAVPMVIVVTLAAILGLVGNIIVAGLLCCPGRRPRTPSSFYLLHRAIADACVQVCQPLIVVTLVVDGYPWACIFNSACMQMGMMASTVFLSGFAMESYMATKPSRFPSQIRWRLMRTVATVACVSGLGSFTVTGLGMFRRGDMCLEAPLFLIHTHDDLFVCLLVVFLLPLVVLVASVALMLKGQTVTGAGTGNREVNTRKQTKTATETGGRHTTATFQLPRRVRLLAALSVVFALTHLPYWTLRIYYSRVRELLPFSVHAVVISLVVVGTALDPLLGVWYRVELWQRVVARLPSHPSDATPLHTVTFAL